MSTQRICMCVWAVCSTFSSQPDVREFQLKVTLRIPSKCPTKWRYVMSLSSGFSFCWISKDSKMKINYIIKDQVKPISIISNIRKNPGGCGELLWLWHKTPYITMSPHPYVFHLFPDLFNGYPNVDCGQLKLWSLWSQAIHLANLRGHVDPHENQVSPKGTTQSARTSIGSLRKVDDGCIQISSQTFRMLAVSQWATSAIGSLASLSPKSVEVNTLCS